MFDNQNRINQKAENQQKDGGMEDEKDLERK